MSDTATSGDASVAPAATVSAPPVPAATPAQDLNTAAFPTFGNKRGSGLARGKRPGASSPATPNKAADPAPTGYTPTAIQIVQTERPYTNPFAPEQPAAPAEQPAAVAPVEKPVAAASVAAIETPVASPAPAPVGTVQPASVPVAVSTPAPEAVAIPASPAPKAELKILPPEEKARPAQSWESDSFGGQSSSSEGSRPQQGRREDRPIFRPERRERDDRPAAESQAGEPRRDFREAREPREPRDPREAREPRQPRDPRDQREPREKRSFDSRPAFAPTPAAPAAEEKKSGGFFAWLKNLFSGDTAEAEKTNTGSDTDTRSGQPGERRFDDHGGRRRHRGGRGGRGGGGGGGYRGERSDRGPSAGGEARGDFGGQGPAGEQGQGGGYRGGGGGHRRHRGGRGRGGSSGNYRNDRGENRGGEGRSDGPGPAAS